MNALMKDISADRAAAPRIWINTPGKDAPDWVVEAMTTGQVASDGTFNIDTPKGIVRVLKGQAVVEVDGFTFGCPSNQIQTVIAEARANPPKPGQAKPPAPPEPRRTAPPAAVASTSAPAAPPPSPEPTAKPKAVRPLIALGSPPTIEWVGVDRLKVDDSYQRDIEGGASQSLIRQIAMEWDWRLCIPLLVSRRADGMYVIDGQHRKEGAEARGDIPHLPCAVFTFEHPAEEAELFVQANKSRRPMQRLDQFHAAIVAGDEKACAINSIVTEAGLTVGRNQAWQMIKPGEVVFVNAVQRLARIHGRDEAVAALKLIAEAFEGQPFPTAGAMFEALMAFVAERKQADTPVDMALLGRVLAAIPFKEWKGKVEGAANGYQRNDMMKAALTAAYDEAQGEG